MAARTADPSTATAGPGATAAVPGPAARLDALLDAARAERAALDALFDRLAPVPVAALVGRWAGRAFPTGDVWAWLLRPRPLLRWHGKRFASADRVDALVVRALGLTFAAPLGAAVLRPVEFRGRVSAAMIYRWLPIIDHFRAVDADTVMGVMETRGRIGAYFALRREPAEGG